MRQIPEPASERPVDPWIGADRYERFMGRWSGRIATEFLAWLTAPARKRWLDVGCGTGVLSRLILQQADPLGVIAVDPSQAFINFLALSLPDDRLSARVGSASALPLPPHSVDLSVSGLALNFFPDPDRALAEMVAATAPGGLIAAYVWDYAGRMQMLRLFWDAVVRLDPEAAPLDEGRRFPLCTPQALDNLFRRARLQAVEVAALEVFTTFQDFDDYWSPFLGQVGPAPSYVNSLPEAQRSRLRAEVQKVLPAQADGSIELVSRAWAVQGHVP